MDGYSEVPRLVAAFRAAGIRAEQGTVADLRLDRSGVCLRDLAVDVVYRDLALEDLGPPEGRGLGGFLDRFDAGRGAAGRRGRVQPEGAPRGARAA